LCLQRPGLFISADQDATFPEATRLALEAWIHAHPDANCKTKFYPGE
jgi:hypothetical protein